jgi:peptide/nickel transport system substrate-binding protein
MHRGQVSWNAVLKQSVNRRRALGAAGFLTGVAALTAACGGGTKKGEGGTGRPVELRQREATVAAGEQPKYGGVGKYVTSGEPPDLDPRLTLSFGLHNWLGSIMNRVVRTVHGAEAQGPADFTLKPDLATAWEQPEDLMSITFKLRQGVTWHNRPPVNGRELVAEDIKYSFEMYAKTGAHTAAFELLDRVETPDKYTAKFILKQPFSGLLEVLTVPTQWVFARDIIEKEGDLKKTAIGTGPFIQDSFERGVGFKGSKNPAYFEKGLPYLDAIELLSVPDASTRKNGFRTGQFDVLSGILPNEVDELLKTNPNIQVEEYPGSHSVFGLAVQQTRPPWNDVRVRRAVSMAVDRRAQVKSIFQDHGILGWGIPFFFHQENSYTDDQLGPWYKYNVAEAKKLMEAAGFKDGFKDTLTYFEYNAAMTSQVQLVQAQLKANLNIDLTIKPLDYTTWFQWYTSHKWEGTAWGFQIGSSSTIDDFCYQNIHSKSVANYWYIADGQIDNLAEKIRSEADNQKKRALIRQMFERDQDIASRLWMPASNPIYVKQPYLRNFRFMYLRGGGGADYGGAARAQHWHAK